ncbi:hypothetical protein HanXRQr2_Chr15g0707161 [Helianthus annuus]|uniref:Uncharacterized protein n=1 Tax=Helianthus annuus TaxID=4232 RepID=A0A251S9Z5_HELAN|nr:uncharacterized protein LOC110909994 [Helianthus annuus]KAF5765731.1 hypothetical protein HanXRQr2_Chr15g0707161 [Helianthus annuus]KAJ0832427.1 hypothetical protein HanPSC8_Chr15g0678681 [Helianthus annuus]
MALSTKTTLLISLILIVYIFPVIGSTSDADHACSPHKGQFRMHARKLSMLDAMLDYDDAGANPKHERKGKPGGSGGRNP